MPEKVSPKKTVKATAISSKKISLKEAPRVPSKVANKARKNSGKKSFGKSEGEKDSTSTALAVIESNENQKIMHCAACGDKNIFIFDNRSWYCDQCGRDKHAAVQYLQSKSLTQDRSKSEYNERGLKEWILHDLKLCIVWVLIFAFFLIICLIAFYGFDDTVKMVKDLLKDLHTLLLKILAGILIILIIFLVLVKMFWK